jgi:delta 1-pyrroline-5-carboxylate dehydrogenase
VLRGLGDPLQSAIAAQGLRVRTYCPVGDLVAGMAYLVRACSRTPPTSRSSTSRPAACRWKSCWRRRRDRVKAVRERADPRAAAAPVARAADAARWSFDAEPLQVPVWIGDDARTAASSSRPTRRPERVVAEAAVAADADVDHALDRRERGSRLGAGAAAERAEVLVRAAAVAARAAAGDRRAGGARDAKPWREADADVCEAIDFLEYYARGASRSRAPAAPGST